MIFVIIVGYIYDVLGRKITLCSAIAIQAGSMFFLPLMAPNVFPGVYLFRMLYAIASMGPVCSPMTNDYVKRGSRGRANALNSFGF